MDDNKVLFSASQAPVESEIVEENLVKLPRAWSFWENYEAKSMNDKLDYKDSLENI